MFLLAHTGITLALARGMEKVMTYRGIREFPGVIDYRLVLVGSMLPDIIDKPLGGLVFRESLGNGRICSHTLLFLVLLFSMGMFFWYKSKRTGFLVLAGGSFIHHALDGMWLFPSYLWPVYGWSFPKGDAEEWLAYWIKSLLTDPFVYVPEMIGGLILIFLVVELICQMKLREFIFFGKLEKVSLQKEMGRS